MKISTILDHIDSGHMALPEFQRGYVWNRDQVRALFDSLYRHHPVGSLLVWATESAGAQHRGDGQLAPGVVKLLLDGQQRMTSLYGVIRGKPPRFFDGNAQAFTGLTFNMEREEFAFYSPVKMAGDPVWIDVTRLLQEGTAGLGRFVARLGQESALAPKLGDYVGRLSRVLSIQDVDLHVEEVTGKDKTVDVVVDIFNRVNSGGTKLSKGDLALAKICADWPEARERMKLALKAWAAAGFHFELDWLLRNVNTIVTGEAKFQHLHDIGPEVVQDGLARAINRIDVALNMIGGRLGLDHDGVLFGRFAIPVMARYLDGKGGHLDAVERDKLLFWFVQSGMWGRFSGSVESYIDQDLAAIEVLDGALDRLIEQLRLWHGGLRVEAGHFAGWSVGARFYPVLYMLTRVGEARDWSTGLPLKGHLLGKMSKLEVHHIFPKALLYKQGYTRPEVNAVANFCFQTKDANLQISDKRPEAYFEEVETKHPGALASQWIPQDRSLWRVGRYRDFLEARKELLAEAANGFLAELLHGDVGVMTQIAPVAAVVRAGKDVIPPGGVGSEAEEAALSGVNDWVQSQQLPAGFLNFELVDNETGAPIAVIDLAWPSGLQEGLSQPIAVLLNETPEVLALANAHGFRYFTDVESFRDYVERDILAMAVLAGG